MKHNFINTSVTKELDLVDDNPSEKLIEEFGVHDYQRLERMNSDLPLEQQHHRQISEIKDEQLNHYKNLIQSLIKQEYIYIMDKESGIAFKASVVIGFRDNKLLICCER